METKVGVVDGDVDVDLMSMLMLLVLLSQRTHMCETILYNMSQKEDK